MADEELTAFIEAQGEVVRELERQLLAPPRPEAEQMTAQAIWSQALQGSHDERRR